MKNLFSTWCIRQSSNWRLLKWECLSLSLSFCVCPYFNVIMHGDVYILRDDQVRILSCSSLTTSCACVCSPNGEQSTCSWRMMQGVMFRTVAFSVDCGASSYIVCSRTLHCVTTDSYCMLFQGWRKAWQTDNLSGFPFLSVYLLSCPVCLSASEHADEERFINVRYS